MSKPPIKGAAFTPSLSRGINGKVHQTRSATTANEKTIQSSIATGEGVGRNQLSSDGISTNTALSELIGHLMQFVSIYKLDTVAKQRMEEIITFAKEVVVKECSGTQVEAEQNNVSKIQNAIRTDLQSMYDALARKIDSIQDTSNASLSGIDKVTKDVEASKNLVQNLRGETDNILSKLGQVTNTTDKIASTTQTYRDVLVSKQTPTLRASIDPKVLGDMDRRSKQILVDIFDEEEVNTLGKSLTELINRANEVLDGMADANKPPKVKVETVFKTRKNAVLLVLNSKEAANWVREPGNEETFANAFSKGAHIREREYNLVAPRVPLTFEPENTKHLREIEETNALTPNTLRKARWIKPAARRKVGQTHAYAILTITSVDAANKLIKDGLGICNTLIRPSKLKQEPTQCMKCRRWGHFADKCLETTDTCGTCGGKHRTSACTNRSKFFCVSCGTNAHASWDRACPEFIRRCALIDEKIPDNSMPFFPAEQDWTLVTRPAKVPYADRFPAKYAVNSLPAAVVRSDTRRKGAAPATQTHQGNPNLIPISANSRYGPKEPGELADDAEGIPEWMREPIEPTVTHAESGHGNGDVTQQPSGWD